MISKFLSVEKHGNFLSIAFLALRISAGILMAYHGYQKLTKFSEIEGRFMEFMGLSSSVSLGLAVFAEFFCSVLLVVGLFTRLALVPLIVTMVVATFKAHHGEIFGDGEKAFMFLAMYVTLLFTGPGSFSLDALLFKNRS